MEKDEEVDILETDDPDWYMTKTKGGYGFVPRTYVEVTTTAALNGNVPPSLPEPIHEEEETAASSIIAPSSATTPSLPPPPPPPAPPTPSIQQPVSKPTDSPGESVRTLKSMLPPPPPPPTKQPTQPALPSQDTISHFSVIEGKKKKGTKVNLGISNSVLIIDSGDDTVPPQRYDISDVSNCTTKKTLLVIDIGGGYLSDALEFTCGSSSEAEHIQEAVNSARRGMFIGDKPFDESHGKSAAAIPPPPPPKYNAPEETSKEFAVLLYDFVGQDSDELTANEGSRVLVLDKSDPEWWQIQLDLPNGQSGLVPATYLELQPAATSGTPVRVPSIRKLSVPPPPPPPPPSMPEVTVIPPKTESNLHRQKTNDSDNVPLHVLQKRQAVHKASQAAADAASTYSMQLKHENQGPNVAKVRTWTDTSGAFKVEAEFLQLTPDGQVHLHKTNDKKITVPLVRFCVEDRQYVNSVTGQNGTKSVSSPQKPTKSMTARQRQQETAKKDPERRPINYDWDWFDFFTLKGGVSADNALKYATAFVADRLDDESIPEITDESMRSLGVKPADITRLNRAFRVHQGLPVPSVDTMADGYSPSPGFSSPPPTQAETAIPVTVDATSNPSMSPITSPLASGGNDSKQTAPTTANSKPAQRESTSNNPWAMDSELDRRFARQRQIETDEDFARKLQEEEKGQKSHFWKGRSRSKSKSKSPSSHKKQPSSSDPFSTLDGSGGSSSRRSAEKKPANKQPLNLGAGSRKSTVKSQTPVVDPAQLRSAQQILGGGLTSPVHARTASRSAMDQVFGSGGSPIRSSQQHNLVSPPPPRARPTAGPAAASSNVPQPSELTTNRMAAATASGNMAQINQLEQMARSKAQELATQEAHVKQQQEEIRKQAMFLQQQQRQLLQMQQTQKVEAQLKQLKEEKERLEVQRQADEMKKQMELLKTQQANMLKMQQMANQARVQQNSGVSAAAVMPMNVSTFQQQQQPVMSSVGISTPITPMSAQSLSPQQQQPRPTAAPLTSRLPPPLIPSQMSKPVVATSNPTGMFSTSSAQLNPPAGFANMPAASSSTTRLTPGPGGIFSNQSVTGSTPNLGSFANTPPVMTSVGGSYGNSAAATHSVTNFTSHNTGGNNGQQQLMYQQQLPMATSNINSNNVGSKYDLFKSVNPHAPSVFNGNMQQQSVVTSTSSSSVMNNSRPSGPTGIFAMANPTMNNPQQQQQNNMFRPNQMMNANMGHQQQMFNNQNLQPGNAGGFGGQWH